MHCHLWISIDEYLLILFVFIEAEANNNLPSTSKQEIANPIRFYDSSK